jgi:hypothetical protein
MTVLYGSRNDLSYHIRNLLWPQMMIKRERHIHAYFKRRYIHIFMEVWRGVNWKIKKYSNTLICDTINQKSRPTFFIHLYGNSCLNKGFLKSFSSLNCMFYLRKIVFVTKFFKHFFFNFLNLWKCCNSNVIN